MVRYSSKGKGSLFDGGDFVSDAILRKHLTRKEVAAKCGISAPRFSNILNGWERPRKQELNQMIIVLDLNISEWRKQSSYVKEIFESFGEGGGYYD